MVNRALSAMIPHGVDAVISKKVRPGVSLQCESSFTLPHGGQSSSIRCHAPSIGGPARRHEHSRHASVNRQFRTLTPAACCPDVPATVELAREAGRLLQQVLVDPREEVGRGRDVVRGVWPRFRKHRVRLAFRVLQIRSYRSVDRFLSGREIDQRHCSGCDGTQSRWVCITRTHELSGGFPPRSRFGLFLPRQDTWIACQMPTSSEWRAQWHCK